MAFSPDGVRIVSGGQDKSIKIWDAATGRLLRTLDGHSGTVRGVAFSRDGARIVSGSEDRTVRQWDAATGRLLGTFSDPYAGKISSVAFSPDGSKILAGSSNDYAPHPEDALMLFETATGRLLRTFSGHLAGVNTAAFSPDGARIVSASDDRTMKVWDASTGTLLLNIEAYGSNETFDRVWAVAFSPDGTRILTGRTYSGPVKLWDAATGTLLKEFASDQDGFWSVAFSPDGSRVAGCGKVTKIWDGASAQILLALEHESLTCALSPDGNRIITGGSHDNALRLWDIATGRQVRSFEGHHAGVSTAVFSPDGSRIFSGGWEPKLKVWSTEGRLLRTFEGFADSIFSLAVAEDGRTMLVGSRDGTLALLDAATGSVLHRFGARPPAPKPDPNDIHALVASTWREPDIISVALSRDARHALAAESGDSVKLWDVASGKLLHTWKHSYFVTEAAFSPDGTRVVSGCIGTGESGPAKRTLQLWDTQTGQRVHDFGGHIQTVTAVAFSPDNVRVVSGDFKGALTLWDATGGHALWSFSGHSSHVTALAFSKDGKEILSGSDDGTVNVWSTETGGILRVLKGHSGSVLSVAFSSGGRVLSAGRDSSIRLWEQGSGELLASFSSARDGSSLVMTPEGFFDASAPSSAERLSIVRGLEVYGVNQIYQALFNPDLVREKLTGDSDGDVRKAASNLDLEKVLASGKAPSVAITAPSSRTLASEVIKAQARIEDRGGGIGRIEWRVNGITVGVSSGATQVEQTFALDPGDNIVEVVAYNRRNLMSSEPTQIKVAWTGTAGSAKPKLHVLAIGINKYVDAGFTNPATGRTFYFPRLALAVADAKAFGAVVEAAAKDRYSSVDVTFALDSDATRSRLDDLVDGIAARLHPRDVFILYAAAHGYSTGGRFYLIPQDYQAEGNDVATSLARHAIGQERLQDWLVNRIKAKKAIVLLDTCASGALVADYSISHLDLPASGAAIGRLHEATGRPVLTAAAAGKDALEGVGEPGKKHGVFTFAVIEAIANGDRNGNGVIELSELAAYVQKRVPEISPTVRLKGREPVTQKPKLGSRGEDFAVVRRLH